MAAGMGDDALPEGAAAVSQGIVQATPQEAAAKDPALHEAQELLKAQQAAAAEKTRQAEARKEVAELKRKQAKDRREKDKKEFEASNAGKAKAQLRELQAIADSCSVYAAAAKTAKFMAPNMRVEWQKTFESSSNSLRKTSGRLKWS